MKNKLLLALVGLLLSAGTVFADLPFRNHRYDAFKVLKVTPQSIVFIGNSITNMHDWHSAFNNPNVLNRGVSGAYTSEVLENLSSFIAGKPAKVFLMIGTNDLGTEGINNTPYVAGKVEQIIDRIQKESPKTEVYIQSILPSTSGIRTLKIITETNAAIKAVCEQKGVTYVDLYDDLMGITTNVHSLDKLHLLASGYRIWCNKVAPYVGSECIYPEDAVNQRAGLSAAYDMRLSCFGMSKVRSTDVLVIGDEMINGGEWHELLHCGDVRNYGQAWGYAGPSIANTLTQIPIILKGRSDNEAPASVFLYAGVADVNGTTSLSSIKTTYKSIVDKIHELAPTTKVYIMSLQPTNNANTNTGRVVPFNQMLQEMAASDENAEYVDIYTGFVSTSNVGKSEYFSGNYLIGKGYAKVSEVMAPLISGATPTAAEEAVEIYEDLSARNALGAAVAKISGLSVGEGVGQYTEENMKEAREAVEAAYALLAKDGAEKQELVEAAANIQAIVTSLLPKINMPKVSVGTKEYWYKMCSSLRGNRYLTSNGSGAGLTGNAVHNRANGMWKFVERTDGTWDIVNRDDNSYINPSVSHNTQVSTSATVPSRGWTLSYSDTPGMFIISSGTTELNQTNSSLSYKIYNWSSGQDGQDRSDAGCQFTIEEAGEPDAPAAAPAPFLVKTDVALDGSGPYQFSEEEALSVFDEEKLTVAIDVTLKNNATEQCLLGCSNSNEAQSFVSIFVNTNGKYGVRFNNGNGLYTGNGTVGTSRHKVIVTFQPENPSYTYYLDGSKVRDVAAVSPTFNNVEGVNGLYLGGVVCSDNANKYPMNGTIHSVQFFSGVLTADQIAAINYNNLIPTGIDGLVSVPGDAQEAVYDLSGRRVKAAGKGIYIVNGQKVIR